MPTLLDLVGAPIPSRLPGKSAVPLLRGETGLSDNDVVIDWNGRDVEPNQDADLHRVESPPQRGLISSDGWKLKLAVGDVNELYDLNSDPSERRNLIDDPTQIARIRDMASRIRDWQLQTEDSAPLPSF